MLKKRARSLRQRMTPQEVKLWMHLRGWRTRGFHFRRQVPRAGYVVDFACLTRKLIIELDGSQHALRNGVVRDARRDLELMADGFRVLRVWNDEIDRNLDGVLQMIEATLVDFPHPGPAGRPSPGEGGMGI